MISDANRQILKSKFSAFDSQLMLKRVFTAIDVSLEAKQKVFDYIETLRGKFSNVKVGWEKYEKLHLTLKFLGDIDEKQLKNLIAAVENTAQEIPNFNLQISETGVFPSPKDARIIWLGVKNEQGSLPKLNEILEAECAKIGFPKEKRNFKPHLTIARLRAPRYASELADTHLQKKIELIEFEVSQIAIYESELRPNGSIYKTIKNVKFKIEV